ncbi:MAG TPA: hypothetical protein VJL58_09510 [Pyrinomonadaceae bacterium]|nr:hypothetical protein [Pyrinomonadaceae bacterium]
MAKLFVLLSLLTVCAICVAAQPRPAEKPATSPAPKKIAPETFTAKYEGGFFGMNSKQEGTLKFDGTNNRFVFFAKDGTEKFGIPYHSVLMIYPQSKSVQSTGGAVASHIPLPGAGLFGLIKEKRQYLVLHFDDPDIENARGVINFKIENKELLDAVIQTLAEKAKLTQRGDAYYRPKKVTAEI